MTTIKVSELPIVTTPYDGSEYTLGIQNGASVKVPALNLAAATGASLIGTTPSGTLAASTVAASLSELDTEKASTAALSSGLALKADTSTVDSQLTLKTNITDLSASTGSTLVGTIQSGTGAVTRTVASKLNDTVSVKDFGAVGDGVTNDTVAIQAALNSGYSIKLPKGNYKTSAPLTISTSGAMFYGETGAQITKSGAYDAIVITAFNWSLDHIVVNCNGFGGSGIGIKGGNNLVSFCEVYGSTGVANAHGIYLDGTASVCIYNRIVGNWVHQVGGVGIASNTAPDNVRTENVIYQSGLEGITDDLPSYRSIIANNYIGAACQAGGVGGIGIDQASDGTVTGNIINGTGSNLPAIKTQNNVGSSNFLTLTGNTLTNNSGGGIWLSTNGAYTSNNNVVSSNTFQNNTSFDIKIDLNSAQNTVSSNGVNAVIIDANLAGVNPKLGIRSNFRAYLLGSIANATGDGTLVQVPFANTTFNNGGNFNALTYTFTAPVTALYQANAGVRLQSGTGGTFAQLQIIQSGSLSQTAQAEIDISATSSSYNLCVSDIFPMAKGDTLLCKTVVGGGTKSYAINGSTSTTYFSCSQVG
jgi:hypothetical protein